MLVLPGGEVTHKLTKVSLDTLDTWDQEHDAQGRKVASDNSSTDGNSVKRVNVGVEKGDDVGV